MYPECRHQSFFFLTKFLREFIKDNTCNLCPTWSYDTITRGGGSMCIVQGNFTPIFVGLLTNIKITLVCLNDSLVGKRKTNY